jgi:hypothetical protein
MVASVFGKRMCWKKNVVNPCGAQDWMGRRCRKDEGGWREGLVRCIDTDTCTGGTWAIAD